MRTGPRSFYHQKLGYHDRRLQIAKWSAGTSLRRTRESARCLRSRSAQSCRVAKRPAARTVSAATSNYLDRGTKTDSNRTVGYGSRWSISGKIASHQRVGVCAPGRTEDRAGNKTTWQPTGGNASEVVQRNPEP